MLTQDRQWIGYSLNISRDDIHIVKSEQMFQDAELPVMRKSVTAGAHQ